MKMVICRRVVVPVEQLNKHAANEESGYKVVNGCRLFRGEVAELEE